MNDKQVMHQNKFMLQLKHHVAGDAKESNQRIIQDVEIEELSAAHAFTFIQKTLWFMRHFMPP